MGRKFVWEVPLLQYPDVCQLIMQLARADRVKDVVTLEELTDRLKGYPAFPVDFQPGDVMEVRPLKTTMVEVMN